MPINSSGNCNLGFRICLKNKDLVFNLRYYDEMPYEEMSKVLDTSEGALKASYHHAAKKIEEFILNN